MSEGPFRARFSVELEGYGRVVGERNDLERLRSQLERYVRTWAHDDSIQVNLVEAWHDSGYGTPVTGKDVALLGDALATGGVISKENAPVVGEQGCATPPVFGALPEQSITITFDDLESQAAVDAVVEQIRRKLTEVL